MSNVTNKTELRHLKQQERRKIENLLNASDSWKELISIIPKELDLLNDASNEDLNDQNEELLIDNSKYELLEQQKFAKNGSASKALLDYWSTYSMRRPTIEHLIYYSAKCNLNRLVEYLAIDLLKVKFNSKIEFDIKTKNYLINKFLFNNEQSEQFNQFIEYLKRDNSKIDLNTSKEANQLDYKTFETDCNIRTFKFDLIKKYTNNFNENKIKEGGNKLGEGGFGVVYLARVPKDELINEKINCELDHKNENYLIAVKVVSNEFKSQYLNELKYLAEFGHPNLLNLIGLTYSGNTLCILSEYMINGSLQDCLLQTNFKPLDFEQRIKITRQIIDAICHLHTFKKVPLVHRDIKTSNILLDRNFNSKLCDFGLARLGSLNNKTINTFNIIGTNVYMSPEAFKGNISVKIDTFSFGVVLFELLTGLPPIVQTDNEEDFDILSYIENTFGEFEDSEDDYDQDEYEQKIKENLDKRAGEWNDESQVKIAIELFDLARKSTNYQKMKRPTMLKVKELFEQIVELKV